MSTKDGYPRLKTLKGALLGAGVITALAIGGSAHAAAVKLKSYNADPSKTTIAGISSGGYFAQQVHIAYSATFKTGAAIYAGGPYNCARGSVSTAQMDCMTGTPAPVVADYVSFTNSYASAGTIDPTSNLSSTKVYMWSGTGDTEVKQSVMNALQSYYLTWVPSANLIYNKTTAAAHGWESPYGTVACGTQASPYVISCGSQDSESVYLTEFYGTLNAKSTPSTLGGTFIEFDQTEFVSGGVTANSLASSGWMYVPADCAAMKSCKLEVVIHGCVQYYGTIGDKFIKTAGVNEWADTNHIIVVYPQTVAALTGPTNPNGCWDFWGYTGANAVKKAGPQMSMIKQIVDRVTGGWVSASGNPAPTSLAVGTVTYNSVALSWSASTGAAGYNGYRSDTAGGTRTKINASLVTGTSTTATGLSGNTTYYFVVKAQDSSGLESVDSNQVSTTTPTAPVGSVAGPTLTAGTATDTTIPLSWSSVTHATGYNIYQSTSSTGTQTKANSNAITGTAYTVGSLSASTSYYFWGTSVDGAGLEGSEGSSVNKSTTAPAFCKLWTSSVWAHTQASPARATTSGCAAGHGCAVGSGTDLGLDNVGNNVTLKEQPSGYFSLSSDCSTTIGKPTGLTLGTVTTSSAALSWSSVSGASGYNVYYSQTMTGGSGFTKANTGGLVTGTAYTVTGLASNNTYYFQVTAQDSAGAESPPSDQVTATTSTNTQAAPTSLATGTVTVSTIPLTWTAASGANGYNVYTSDKSGSAGVWTIQNSSSISSSPYTITGLAGGTLYYIHATATNASGQESAPSNEVNATTSSPSAPNAPTSLAAGTATDTTIAVTFTASTSSDLKGSNMYAGTASGGPYTLNNSTPIGGAAYTYTGLNSSTTYYLVARAINTSNQESSDSNEVSKSTSTTKPAAPTSVSVADGTTDTTVPLTWTASTGPSLSGYNAYTATQSGGAYTKANSSLISSGATSYTVTSLNPATNYYFIVRAQNSSGTESIDSNQVAQLTLPATYCKIWHTANYTHRTATPARAFTGGACGTLGYDCAIGSGTNIGIDSLAVTSYLKEKPQGYFTYSGGTLTCP